MSKGFSVRNGKSELQVFGDTSNYVYVQGGSVELLSGSAFRGEVTFDVETEYPPIILIRPQGTHYGVFIESVTKSGDFFTGFRLAGYNAGSLDADPLDPVDYRIFFNKASRALATKLDDYGMRVRNNRGELVFDSWDKTFWILDSQFLDLPSDIGAGLDWDGDSYEHAGIVDPWYLVCPQFVANQRFATETPGVVVWFFFTAGIRRISSTECRIAWVPKWFGAGAGGSSSFAYQGTQANVIICQVSRDLRYNP